VQKSYCSELKQYSDKLISLFNSFFDGVIKMDYFNGARSIDGYVLARNLNETFFTNYKRWY